MKVKAKKRHMSYSEDGDILFDIKPSHWDSEPVVVLPPELKSRLT